MRSSLLVLLLCLLVVVSSGCQHKGDPPSTTPTPKASMVVPSSPSAVSYSQGRVFSVKKELSLIGTVVADKTLSVPSRATGQLLQVMVVEGDRVGAGQTLATVDTAESRLAVKQAQAELSQQLAVLGMSSSGDKLRDKNRIPAVIKAKAMMDNAELVYKRYQGLHREQLVSDVELSNQRASYIAAKADYDAAIEGVNQSLAAVEAAELAVEIAQQKVTEAVITAPVDGIVDTVTAARGAYVSSGSDSGITLLKIQPLYVSLDIPQQQLGEFSRGEVLSFTTPGFPGRRLRATVDQVAAAVNVKSDALSARARVIDPPQWLQPGMAAEIELETGRQPEQRLFPQAAVLTQAGKSVVFVVDSAASAGAKATVSQKAVTLGPTVGDWVVIAKGELQPEETVVTSDLLALKSGSQVELGKPLIIAAPESSSVP